VLTPRLHAAIEIDEGSGCRMAPPWPITIALPPPPLNENVEHGAACGFGDGICGCCGAAAARQRSAVTRSAGSTRES